MKLARINLNPNATEGKYRLTVPPHVNDKLHSYKAMYQEVYGEEVATEMLIIGVIEQFLEADADFRVWKRDRDGSPAASAPGETGLRRRGPKPRAAAAPDASTKPASPANTDATVSS